MAKLNVGQTLEKIRALQVKQEKFEAQANALKTQVDKLKEQLLAKVKKADLDGAASKSARASVIETEVAQVEDWEAFMDYVSKYGHYDLVQRRVSNEAYRARLADKVKVPGLGRFTKVSLRVTKR